MITIDDSFHSTKRSKNDGGPDDGEAPVIVSLVEAAMQMFSAAIDALPPARTLDVACGSGFLTRHLPGDIVGEHVHS